MKKEDELFVLVKSLSTSEKRYFRRFCRLYDNKAQGNYMKVFDAMDKMREYDEGQLKEKLGDKKFVKQIGVTKLYLKNLIVRALRNYYEENVPYVANVLSLADAHIMTGRWLFSSADKKIQKEKAHAIKEERFADVLKWIEMEEYLLLQSGLVKELNERSEGLSALRKLTFGKYLNISDYSDKKNHLLWVHQNYGTLSQDERKNEFEKLLSSPLMRTDSAALSFTAMVQRAELMSRLLLLTNRQDESITLLRQILDRIDAGEFGFEVPLHKHFPLINSLFGLLMARNELKEAAKLVGNAEAIVQKHKGSIPRQYEARLKKTILQYKGVLALFNRQFQDALKVHEELKELVKLNKMSLENEDRVTFWTLELLSLVELGQFRKGLLVANDLINSGIQERKDLTMYAHWMAMVCHIELKHYDIIRQLGKHALMYAAKNKLPLEELDPVAKGLISLAKTIKEEDDAGIKAATFKLLEHIKTSGLYYVNFENWLGKRV